MRRGKAAPRAPRGLSGRQSPSELAGRGGVLDCQPAKAASLTPGLSERAGGARWRPGLRSEARASRRGAAPSWTEERCLRRGKAAPRAPRGPSGRQSDEGRRRIKSAPLASGQQSAPAVALATRLAGKHTSPRPVEEQCGSPAPARPRARPRLARARSPRRGWPAGRPSSSLSPVAPPWPRPSRQPASGRWPRSAPRCWSSRSGGSGCGPRWPPARSSAWRSSFRCCPGWSTSPGTPTSPSRWRRP